MRCLRATSAGEGPRGWWYRLARLRLSRSACIVSGSWEPSRSTGARRSTLARREAKFFFEPRDLRGEAADLGVERRQLRLVGGLERLDLGAPLEQTRQASQRRRLPL